MTQAEGLSAADAELAHQCAIEQAELLRDRSTPWLPRLDAQVTLPDGRPGLLMPHYMTLERRLSAGLPLAAVIHLAVLINSLLVRSDSPHGNLRLSNIFLDDAGRPVLSDVLTSASFEHWRRLGHQAHGWLPAAPPEADGAPRHGWDTWALCALLYQAATTDAEPHTRHAPLEGLDKLALAELRDRTLAKLRSGQANKRFADRVASRLATLLNRGLSAETHPTPPYRFNDPAALGPRLAEIDALVDPRVDDVGHLLLGASAEDGVFQGPATISFSVTVACSPGLHNHEDIAAGVRVTDLDAEEGVRVSPEEVRYTVRTHPSGRLRFAFELLGLAPGRYGVRAAFLIRDSHHEPLFSEGRFQLRPPPGWVPPAKDPPPQLASAIRLHDHTRSVAPPEDPLEIPEDDADCELIEGMFPSPIAPSTFDDEAERSVARATGTDAGQRAPQVTPLSPLDLRTDSFPMEPCLAPTAPPEPEHGPLPMVAPSARAMPHAMPSGPARPVVQHPRAAPTGPQLVQPAVAPPSIALPTFAPPAVAPSRPAPPALRVVPKAPTPSAAPATGPKLAMPGPALQHPTHPGPISVSTAANMHPAPGPTIGMPPLQPSDPGLGMPRPSMAPAEPSLDPSLPDLEVADFIPGAENTASLPTFDSTSAGHIASPGVMLDRAVDLLRGDSWIALIAASSIAFGLLVVLFVLTKACG